MKNMDSRDCYKVPQKVFDEIVGGIERFYREGILSDDSIGILLEEHRGKL